MDKKMKFSNTAQKSSIYQLKNFQPQLIDQDYLKQIGLNNNIPLNIFTDLQMGSRLFIERFNKKMLVPKPELTYAYYDLSSSIEIHNYTGACPTLTYEINPVKGCYVGCLYCLVTDGEHINKLIAYQNYPDFLRINLEKNKDERHFYYFSPKTEAFQEATLESGLAHNILKEFIRHFEQFPDSKARLFIASKAGIKQLNYRYNNDKLIDLMCRLRGKMQFNTSLALMPQNIQELFEPNAATLEERLGAIRLCQKHKILADSALVQPIILPYLTEAIIHDFFCLLKNNNIINIKPEFLTLCGENLAMLGQIIGFFDKNLEKKLYEVYCEPDNQNHIKQRKRIAPSRQLSKQYLDMIMKIADSYGISTSICYWVREQLDIREQKLPLINKNGYQCLGYKANLFD